MLSQTIGIIVIASLIGWESDRAKPKPYPLGGKDTLMIRISGYEFCPQYCAIDHFHVGHKRNYKCEVDSCTHIIYEDRLK